MDQTRAQVSGSLARALGVGQRGVYAFVGAGGKSSAIRRLLSERPQALATTTTHLSSSGFAHGLLAVAPDAETLHRLQESLSRARPLTLALSADGPRLQSPSLSWHLDLYSRHSDELVFVEADGAARRMLKRPASHEPAWPPASTASSIILVGLGALGEPVDLAAHRPSSFRRAQLGAATVGLEHFALMLRDYVQAAPPRTSLTLLFTGVRSQHEPALAELTRHFQELVRGRDPLLQDPNVALRVVACEDLQAGPYRSWHLRRDTRPRVPHLPGVCGILLAAGRGARFQPAGEYSSKLLSRWRRRPLIEHAVAQWCSAGFAELVVVLGHAAREIEPQVRSAAAKTSTPLRIVHNRRHSRGLGTSVRTAVRHATPGLSLLFGHADMPALRSPTLRDLATLGSNLRHWIVVPTVLGSRRNPAFFPADLRSDLLKTPETSGGKAVSDANPSRVLEVDMEAVDEFVDVDRPADLQLLLTPKHARRAGS